MSVGPGDYEILAESAPPERTLVLASGDTFAVFDRRGGFEPGSSSRHGLYVDGSRFLARFELRIAGRLPLLLGSGVRPGAAGFFVHETNPDLRGRAGPTLERDLVHIVRRVTLEDASCAIELTLRSYADREIELPLELGLGADFADVFEVRGSQRVRRGEQLPAAFDVEGVRFGYRGLDGVERRTFVRLPAAAVRASASAVRLSVSLKPGERLRLPIRIECALRKGERPYRQGFARTGSARVREPIAGIETSSAEVDAWLAGSRSDLAMLTTDTAHGPFPYAGVPWFFTPFGRDALVTAYELLWIDPALARSVLAFLAAHQSTHDDPARDAEIGKILHEMRAGEMAALGEVPFACYYGSVDATPLFVLLAAAYHERTGDDGFLESLWPALELALAWIDGPGDPDGDGFVEYARRAPSGLANQGWKDSRDAVMHADGTLAEGPLALCEVQAYVFGAKRGLARVARRLDRPKRAAALEEAALRLRGAFARAFWCDELGSYALALDGRKRPCRVRSSNAGHALWTGLALDEHADAVASALGSDDLFSGWGVRTLASSSARYNPMSYHNGSVWPHDNALLAAGLARYGHTRAAGTIFSALFDAWRALDDARLPELLCGFERRPDEAPTRYPVACSPQAWAAGAVFLLLQSVLGLRVDAVERQVHLSHPRLPTGLDRVALRGLAVGSARLDLQIERNGERVDLHVARCSGPVDVVLSN